tara:strand:+ start:1601 stop:1954 length:354 start_codon:yes stop_codon:yes gene_type:complete
MNKDILDKIIECLLDKKAIEINVIDVKEITSLTDTFIVCSSESDPQTKAIMNHLTDTLSADKIKPLHIEGHENLKWVLIDYIDIVINIFNKETREYYNIERLWNDAKIKKIKESYEA